MSGSAPFSSSLKTTSQTQTKIELHCYMYANTHIHVYMYMYRVWREIFAVANFSKNPIFWHFFLTFVLIIFMFRSLNTCSYCDALSHSLTRVLYHLVSFRYGCSTITELDKVPEPRKGGISCREVTIKDHRQKAHFFAHVQTRASSKFHHSYFPSSLWTQKFEPHENFPLYATTKSDNYTMYRCRKL